MKRIVTVQDISCVGKCSLTVALPIISSMGIEASILPTAVLSTHTMFKNFTCQDLTDQIVPITEHWKNEGIGFKAIYTGYLGSFEQIDLMKKMFDDFKTEDTLLFVDPAMADNGNLYPGFDKAFVEAMKGLCGKADYVLPNITEACFLTDMEYKTEYDRAYIDELLEKLAALGCKNIIFTGISYEEGKTGVVVYEDGKYSYYEHEKRPNSCHGTGDIYASAFVGAYVRGKSAYDAAKIAADYTVECIKATAEEDNHWYGAKFEPVLMKLIQAINE